MTHRHHLRAALHETAAPILENAGFSGTRTTWSRLNDAGDTASVNVKIAATGVPGGLRCSVNLSVTPAPWVSWLTHFWDERTGNVSEAYALFSDRLVPALPSQGGGAGWVIENPSDARAAVQDMARQLSSGPIQNLIRLLDRNHLLQAARTMSLGQVDGPSGVVYCKRSEAVLLAEEGHSVELERILGQLSQSAEGRARESHEKFANWARSRARKVPAN